jgi:HlyD family secretion protein
VRRDIVQSVVAAGRVARPHRVDIGAQIVGLVNEIPVAEGSHVAAGQALIVLDATESVALVRQAETAVAQAEARLRQLRELQLPVARESLRQAEANLANARAQYQRQQKLKDSGFVGDAALDDVRRNVEVAQTQVETARKQVQTAQPSGSDVALARTALEQAQASLQAARARLQYCIIAAPVAGTLIARDVERGDVVQPGKVLMVLSPAGETQLVLQLDERNLALVRVGQKALASADAYPKERFDAEVVYINPAVDAQRGTVEVKLRVPEPPAYLRDDMTVSVDIEIARRAAALTLAAEAVRDAAGREAWVLAVRDGRARRQGVKLGLRGEGSVEILAGLAEGELVLAGQDATLADGRRVRPRARE